ncbi:MAG TPA: VWA domain-containing protein [Chitinophagaceae bacterium]|nr:VWA domain-containing protein [Chitinophagaceae bacterium]
MNFRFEHIQFLIGFALLPLLLVLFFWLLAWKKKMQKKIGDPTLVEALVQNYSPLKFAVKFAVAMLALALIVLAAANLQRPGVTDRVNRKGVDVMVALDVSNSMLAEDSKPNRLERAKQLVTKLMDRMENDRIGLVLFAGRAYMQMPLTTDHGAAKMYIQNAGPEAVPVQGTVIGEALKIANSGFNSKERKYKAIVLISDGEDHDPEALQLAKSLSQNGVMINSVGIGSPEGAPIIDHATNEVRKDAQGSAIVTKLNEVELQQLAEATHGVYLRLDDTDDAAAKIMAQLSTIEQTATGDRSFTDYKSYFQWFLALALVLLMIETFIPERKMKMA